MLLSGFSIAIIGMLSLCQLSTFSKMVEFSKIIILSEIFFLFFRLNACFRFQIILLHFFQFVQYNFNGDNSPNLFSFFFFIDSTYHATQSPKKSILSLRSSLNWWIWSQGIHKISFFSKSMWPSPMFKAYETNLFSKNWDSSNCKTLKCFQITVILV